MTPSDFNYDIRKIMSEKGLLNAELISARCFRNVLPTAAGCWEAPTVFKLALGDWVGNKSMPTLYDRNRRSASMSAKLIQVEALRQAVIQRPAMETFDQFRVFMHSVCMKDLKLGADLIIAEDVILEETPGEMLPDEFLVDKRLRWRNDDEDVRPTKRLRSKQRLPTS